jgi:ribosomal protein L29
MTKAKKTETNSADFGKVLADNRRALQELGFRGAGSRVANVRQSRTLRRDIARALTTANKSPNKSAKE